MPRTTVTSPRLCPGCGGSLDHRDAQALTCSARCRQRVHRARVDGYDPDTDYRRRSATWDPVAALARLQSLDLQPAAPLVDPADRLRGRRWLPLVDPTDPRRRRERGGAQ